MLIQSSQVLHHRIIHRFRPIPVNLEHLHWSQSHPNNQAAAMAALAATSSPKAKRATASSWGSESNKPHATCTNNFEVHHQVRESIPGGAPENDL